MAKYFRFILVMVFSLWAVACEQKKVEKKIEVNPEIMGMWKSDDGCQLILEKNGNDITLVKFSTANASDVGYTNLQLKAYKESIMTKFKPVENSIHLNISFLEGVIMVEQYCKQPLHKTDNY